METPVTVNDVLSIWGISDDHPLVNLCRRHLLDQVFQSYLDDFNENPDEVISFFIDVHDKTSSDIADLTWIIIESLCDEADCKANAGYIIALAGKTLNTLAGIVNQSEKFQIHESALGEAWEIIIQRLAESYGVSIQRALNCC